MSPRIFRASRRLARSRVLLCGLALIGAASGTVASSLPARAVTLVHSNDMLGDIEPCGCRTNPQGGMARKANFMKRLAQERKDPELLQLDAGDMLFSTDVMPEMLASQAELQAGYLLKALDEVHHDAVVPGEKDFALGFKKYEQLVRKSRIKVLAANLSTRAGKKPFAASQVFTRKTVDGKAIKIGVVGLMGEHLIWPKDLKVSPLIPAAKREVAALRKKADLVVALTHQGLERDQDLAKAVPGIDIIVGGHTQSFLQTPLKVGKTTIYQSSFRNQYVGALPLSKPFTGEGYKLVGLDAGYDSSAEAPAKLDDLVKEFKTSIAELNSREEAKLTASAAPSSALASSTKFQTFAKCSECHLKQFDFWRKTPHALALNTLVAKNQAMNKECLSCHTVGLGDPQGFQLVTRLAETQRQPKPAATPGEDGSAPFVDPNAEPVIEPMSTESFAAYMKSVHDAKSLKDQVKVFASGPDAEPVTLRRSLGSIHRAWTPVQCENCHEPGRDHPFSGSFSKKVEKTACLKCHTAERAPEWYTNGKPDWLKIDAKRVLMTCPTGDLNEAED